MKCFKGFDKDLRCKDFQYEVGKKYETKRAEICEEGFHACEFPLDVLKYYNPADSRFCEVELAANEQTQCDSKRCGRSIRVVAEIGLSGLAKAGVKFILERADFENAKATNSGDCSAAMNSGDWSAAMNTGDCSAATNTGDRSAATNTGDWSTATNSGDWSAATNTGNWSTATNSGDCSAAMNTGYRSAATNTGDHSAATNTGDRSAAMNTGYHSAATNSGDWSAATNTGHRSAATVEGKESIAIVTGSGSKASGKRGCWLVLTERDNKNHVLGVQAVKVDGETIKEDAFYTLSGGKVTEVK